MKVYIMTDMEGVAGVLSADDYTDQASRYYEAGRELTTLEVSAAVQGCLDEGATEVLVVDGHGSGAIALRLLHPAATLLAGRPLGYPFGCDETFVAAMMVGQHAKSNTDGGHLSHTGSFAVDELTINGVSVGEMGCNMLFCAHFGVPVVLVTGDEAAAAEAHALVPEIETVAVKSGVRWGPASPPSRTSCTTAGQCICTPTGRERRSGTRRPGPWPATARSPRTGWSRRTSWSRCCAPPPRLRPAPRGSRPRTSSSC